MGSQQDPENWMLSAIKPKRLSPLQNMKNVDKVDSKIHSTKQNASKPWSQLVTHRRVKHSAVCSARHHLNVVNDLWEWSEEPTVEFHWKAGKATSVVSEEW